MIFKLLLFAAAILFFLQSIIDFVGEKTEGLPQYIQFFTIGTVAYFFVAFFMIFTDVIRLIDDQSVDLMNEIFVDTKYTKSYERNYVFIDIDEKTYAHWNYPLLTPRDKLVDVLKIVIDQDPAAIFVDLDLSDAGMDSAAAMKLASFIKNSNEKGKEKIIFMRNVRGSCKPIECAVPFYFEEDLSDLIPWSIPFFETDQDDYSVRTWGINKRTTIKGQIEKVTSPQEMISRAILQKATQTDIDNKASLQRIFYSFTYSFNPSFLGNPENGFFRFSAVDVIDAGRVPQNVLQNSILIIGASHSSSKDIWRTPVEIMPGSVIILNAIKSLLDYGWLDKPSSWKSVSAALGILAVFSFIFSLTTQANTANDITGGKFPRRAKHLNNVIPYVSILLLNLIFWPSSFFIYKNGLWSYIFPMTLVIPFTYKYFSMKSAIQPEQQIRKS